MSFSKTESWASPENSSNRQLENSKAVLLENSSIREMFLENENFRKKSGWVFHDLPIRLIFMERWNSKLTIWTSTSMSNTFADANQVVFTADNAFQLSRLTSFDAYIEEVGYAKVHIRHKLWIEPLRHICFALWKFRQIFLKI